MSKMALVSAPFARYLTPTDEGAAWGLALSGAGSASVGSRAVYPPQSHPLDHELTWARGRVLDALQVVVLTRGSGRIEFKRGRSHPLRRGMAFVLFPGTWHRYRPDSSTGWDEAWVEMRGPLLPKLVGSRWLPLRTRIVQGALGSGLIEAVEEALAFAKDAAPGFTPDSSVIAQAVLSAWAKTLRQPKMGDRTESIVRKAERALTDRHPEAIDMQALSRELGVSYSFLRKAFRRRTGLPPWQYVLRQRLARARRILMSGDATLDEIAGLVGFASGFQLSKAFKRSFGMSPAHLRRDVSA